jgi:hypothetical protein
VEGSAQPSTGLFSLFQGSREPEVVPARTLQYWRSDDGAFLGRFSPETDARAELRCASLPELVAAAQQIERVHQARSCVGPGAGAKVPPRTYVALVPIAPPT